MFFLGKFHHYIFTEQKFHFQTYDRDFSFPELLSRLLVYFNTLSLIVFVDEKAAQRKEGVKLRLARIFTTQV